MSKPGKPVRCTAATGIAVLNNVFSRMGQVDRCSCWSAHTVVRVMK